MDRSKLIVGAIIAVIVVVAVGFAFGPLALNKWRNAHAAKTVEQAVKTADKKGAAAADKANASTGKSIAVVRAKTRQRVAATVNSPDPDSVFFDSVCDSGFYSSDPRCSSRGSQSKSRDQK